MALVRGFVFAPKDENRVHEEVECGYLSFTARGETYLQIDTYGSKHRKIPGKVSQSIQIDSDGARELLGLIRRTFPGAHLDLVVPALGGVGPSLCGGAGGAGGVRPVRARPTFGPKGCQEVSFGGLVHVASAVSCVSPACVTGANDRRIRRGHTREHVALYLHAHQLMALRRKICPSGLSASLKPGGPHPPVPEAFSASPSPYRPVARTETTGFQCPQRVPPATLHRAAPRPTTSSAAICSWLLRPDPSSLASISGVEGCTSSAWSSRIWRRWLRSP